MSLSGILQLAYVAAPAGCWIVNAAVLRPRVHWLLLSMLAFMLGNVLLLTAVQALEIELERELYRHDLDGNGTLSESEMTEDAERAMHAVTADTGRTFAPFTGIPITFVWTSVNFIALAVFEFAGRFVWTRLSRTVNAQRVAVPPSGDVSTPPPSGRPPEPPARTLDASGLRGG